MDIGGYCKEFLNKTPQTSTATLIQDIAFFYQALINKLLIMVDIRFRLWFWIGRWWYICYIYFS